MWIDDNLQDRTDLSPGAGSRPIRKGTKRIIVHRIRYGAEGESSTWVEQIARFFTEDPEGVAVVTVGGSYRGKLPTIAEWKRDGIPEEKRASAFVAYHLIVDPLGGVHQMLPLDCIGAHAYPNGTSLGVAFVGDFRTHDELAGWEKRAGDKGGGEITEEQGVSGRKLLRDLLVRYPDAGIVTHDEALEERGKRPKGCPGANAVPFVHAARSWASAAAQHIRDAQDRR